MCIRDRSCRAHDTHRTPGALETWDAVTGKRLASFSMHYGPKDLEIESGPGGHLEFLEHAVIAFTMPCALPCSTATMYSPRGKYLGLLAAEASSATATHVHDHLYVLHAVNGPFVAQDAVTGTSVQLDT